MTEFSNKKEYDADFLQEASTQDTKHKVEVSATSEVHEQLKDLQKVVVSEELDKLQDKVQRTPQLPFLGMDIMHMPSKESKEYKEVAEEFQSFEASVALLINRCFQQGIPKESILDPQVFFSLNPSLPSDLAPSLQKLKEIYMAGKQSPYYSLFFGGTIWKDAIVHLEKTTKTVEKVIQKIATEIDKKSSTVKKENQPVSLPEKIFSGVSKAAGDMWSWSKENPATAVALAAGGFVAVKVWKWLFAPKEESGIFSTFSSLVKWGGLAGGGLLLMSQYDTIKNYVGSWFGKSGSIMDVGKIAYELIGAIASGDWNKVLQIISYNIDTDPTKKPVYDAMEKASGVDRNFLVYISAQHYEDTDGRGYFEKMMDYVKGIPSSVVNAGKSYFLGFTDQHKGKLLQYLATHKKVIEGLQPKPKTYFEVFEGLYKAGVLDGVSHNEYVTTSSQGGDATASTSVETKALSSEEAQDHAQENTATFAPILALDIVKNNTDVEEKIQLLQKKYMPEETLDAFITECYAAHVDTKKLEELKQKRLISMKKFTDMLATAYTQEQFKQAYAEVEAANGDLWEEYKEVYAQATSRNLFSQVLIDSPKFLKFVRMYERFTKYPALYRYVVYKGTVGTAASAMQMSSIKHTLVQEKTALETKKTAGSITFDEEAKLDRLQKIHADKNFQKLAISEENLKVQVQNLETELSGSGVVDTGNKKANLLKKYKNELELVRLQQEELELIHDMKQRPNDQSLVQKKSALDKKILDTRSQKIENIQNHLSGSGKNKLDKDIFKELDTFKLEVKKQQKLLDKMQADLFQEVRALKGKSQADIDAVKAGILDRTKDFYAKQTQLQTDVWKKFRQVSFSAHGSEDVVGKLKSWVKEVGIVKDGSKLVSMKGKFAIFGATVTAGAVATELTSGGSFMEVLKETGKRMLWGYGTVIDLYEGVTGSNWFHPNERLDNDARLFSTAMGVASGASEVLSLVPFAWGVGLAGKAGVVAVKGASIAKALSKANKLEDALKFLENVKDSKTFLLMKTATGTAVPIALTASYLLMSYAGITISPKKEAEVEITPEMKAILGEHIEEKVA